VNRRRNTNWKSAHHEPNKGVFVNRHRLVLFIAILSSLLLVLSGCDSDAGVEKAETLEKGETADRTDALKDCMGLIQDMDDRSYDSVDARNKALVDSCVRPLRQNDCAAAFDDGLAGLAAFERCQDAYCPTLKEEPPAVCTGTDAADHGARMEFFVAVLFHDYHLEQPPEALMQRFSDTLEKDDASQRQAALARFLADLHQEELSQEQRAVFAVASIVSGVVFGPTVEELMAE
jgi:hypothetical protein